MGLAQAQSMGPAIMAQDGFDAAARVKGGATAGSSDDKCLASTPASNHSVRPENHEDVTRS